MYLSKRHAAEFLDCSIRTIDRLIASNHLRKRKLASGKVLIPEADVKKCFKPTLEDFLNDRGNTDPSEILTKKRPAGTGLSN